MPDTNRKVALKEIVDSRIGLQTFFKIAEAWHLSVDEQIKLLGKPPRSSFFKWKKDGGDLTQDTLERISHIISIYKCLRILFTDQAAADAWIKRPNQAPFLGGSSALDFMTKDGFVASIYEVRRYLDAQRGG